MHNLSEKDILFEHRFWLQILGDHGRFIFHSLSPSEESLIQEATFFIHQFDNLLNLAREPINDGDLNNLTQDAYYYAEQLREFKLNLIKEHLIGKIESHLSPTFINHMVNEVEEYLRILKDILNNKNPTSHPLHYHKLWLVDAAGHTGAIMCGLDSTEDTLRNESKKYHIEFCNLSTQSHEYYGYLRTHKKEFPALQYFNHQVELIMSKFMVYLKEIETHRIEKKVLGTLMPLMADHMFREECYYLISLAKVSKIKTPTCDPTKPRNA